MSTKLFFLHIPKTAGTTLSHSIRQIFDWPDALYVKEPEHGLALLEHINREHWREYRAVYGHFHYGFVRDFCPPEDTPLILTVLREPVQRALSAYGFMKTLTSLDLNPDWSIVEALTSPSNDDWFFADNLMVRFLCEAWRDKNTPCTRQDLEYAKETLLTKIDIIGFQDDHDFAVSKLSSLFNFVFKSTNLNRTTRPIRIDDLTPREEATIRDANDLDNELYLWAMNKREIFYERANRSVASAKDRFHHLVSRGPNDGEYITLQAKLDAAAADNLSAIYEKEQRLKTLDELKTLIHALETHKGILDHQLAATGGEIQSLIALCNDAENVINDRATLLSGRSEHIKSLKSRIEAIESRTKRFQAEQD